MRGFNILQSAVAAVVAVATLAIAPLAQTTPAPRSTGRIIGVFDQLTGEPIAGAQVVDVFSGSYVMTTSTGTATLGFVTFRGAAALVELRKIGYDPKQVMIGRDDTTSVTETMDHLTTLAPVVTTEKYRLDRDAGLWQGFEQRCTAKNITYVHSAELEAKVSANLADFLVRADGIVLGSCARTARIGSGVPTAKDFRNSQCGKISMRPPAIPPAFCQPTFFVDGYEWNSSIDPPIDLMPGKPAEKPFTPANVKAVEVYPPTGPRPMRFMGDPNCGVVVIWTK